MKFTYLGQCDRLRRAAGGELLWQRMMQLKFPVSTEILQELCDASAILDEDENIEDFMAGDPTSGIYASFWGHRKCIFVQTHGFEFIFTE